MLRRRNRGKHEKSSEGDGKEGETGQGRDRGKMEEQNTGIRKIEKERKGRLKEKGIKNEQEDKRRKEIRRM